jgi:hypothetical protein
VHRFQSERHALSAADAERDETAADAVALHRVKEPGGQDCSSCADRVPMGDRSALDVQ